MSKPLPKIILKSCPKNYSRDLDKAVAPEETIKNVIARLEASGEGIYAGSRRVDSGRLGIPVYLASCGPLGRQIMPTRKQMGKGSSPAQAEASAIMELMERFAFFSFMANPEYKVRATWKQAERLFGDALIPIEAMLASVSDNLGADEARELLDLAEWQFYPATNLSNTEIVWLPLDWFRMLGEFNGSSAGNTAEESLLQGLSELIERHVSCIVDRTRPQLPSIDPASCSVPVLGELLAAFERNGVKLILKDISLGMPLPTVAALAWDPSTFPQSSEIVFTAGTASTPEKAAIRAITEVAQLGGDFCTNSCYEASGLPKFSSPAEFQWLLAGPFVPLSSLPTINNNDIGEELRQAINSLKSLKLIQVYALETTHPELGIPAHYSIAPGLEFRERDKNPSLGMFIGRKLIEEAEPGNAAVGLTRIGEFYSNAHFLPFFAGMLAMRKGDPEKAAQLFEDALPVQPDPDSLALAAFYAAYAWTQIQGWQKATKFLNLALQNNPAMKEAANLLGVCFFKLKDYASAECSFDQALKIDKGSAMDLANRGIARKFLGKTRQAREDLVMALDIEPSLDFARPHLADLEGEQP